MFMGFKIDKYLIIVSLDKYLIILIKGAKKEIVATLLLFSLL